MADYIPKIEGELIIWLPNFRSKLATHGETLCLSPEHISALEDAFDTLIAKINEVEVSPLFYYFPIYP